MIYNIEIDVVIHKYNHSYKEDVVYYKQDILANLDTDLNSVFPFKHLNVKQIGENRFLITYQAEVIKNMKSIKSNRTSIWVGKDTFQGSISCLKPRGMMISFGNASGPLDPINVKKDLLQRCLKNLQNAFGLICAITATSFKVIFWLKFFYSGCF